MHFFLFVSHPDSWTCCLQSCEHLSLPEKTSPIQHDRPQLHTWWIHKDTRTWYTPSWAGKTSLCLIWSSQSTRRIYYLVHYLTFFLFLGDLHENKSAEFLLWAASLTIRCTTYCRCDWVMSHRISQQYRIKHKKKLLKVIEKLFMTQYGLGCICTCHFVFGLWPLSVFVGNYTQLKKFNQWHMSDICVTVTWVLRMCSFPAGLENWFLINNTNYFWLVNYPFQEGNVTSLVIYCSFLKHGHSSKTQISCSKLQV